MGMGIAVTPTIQRQLLTIKHLHRIVRDQYAPKADEASRIMAVVLLDYVAESALKTLLWNLPSAKRKPKKDPNFPDLWDTVDDLSGEGTLQLKFEIMSLHELRRLTQHRNAVPSSEDVRDHTTHVAAFLRHVFSQFFALDFNTLSLSALVSHDELREHLVAAERLTAEHRYRDAVFESALALFEALLAADKLLKVTRDWRSDPASIRMDAERAGFTRGQARLIEQLGTALAKVRDDVDERIRVLALGLDYSSYMRYKAAAPIVYGMMDGSVGVHHTKNEYSAEEAAAIFNYALNQILRLEAMGGLPGPGEEE